MVKRGKATMGNAKEIFNKKRIIGLLTILISLMVICVLGGCSNGNASSGNEIYSFRNISEDELISQLEYTKNSAGLYPSESDVIFTCVGGSVNQVYLSDNHKDDYTFLGVKIGENAEDAKTRFEKGFTYQDGSVGEDGNIVDSYTDENGQLMVTYDMQDYSIISICYKVGDVTALSDKQEQNTEEKIPVNVDTYQTVVTLKSNDIDNIQLFTSAGGADKAGKVQEGVCCALLKQQDVNGESWALIDFCNRQGWCKMEMLRTVSGDAQYFYVKPNDTNTVFVNENSIKLHTEAGTKTDIAFKNVTYGTDLNIYEVKNGWGRTMYENTECWLDMNVAGFYASDYWQVERCDGSSKGIKLRKSADEDSEVLATVPLKKVMEMKDHKKGWGQFTYDNKTGWLKLHYATPCGSTSGLSFTEDKTEATTETQPTTEAAPQPTARFAGYCYPYSGYYYSYGRGEYQGVYMILEDVTDRQFTFTLYDENGVMFKTHTAVATSDNTAYYDGKNYKLTFSLDEYGMNILGMEDLLGKFNYFEYEGN